MGTNEFHRLRIGIDRPVHQDDAGPGRSSGVADYVLSSFKKEEKKLIDDKMQDIFSLIKTFLDI